MTVMCKALEQIMKKSILLQTSKCKEKKMQPGFIKGKLNQEGLDLVENQINKIGRNVIIQTPGLVCGFQSGKGGTGPCGGEQSQCCAAYNRNHRGNAVTEMDVVRINCTRYLQAREEDSNANNWGQPCALKMSSKQK